METYNQLIEVSRISLGFGLGDLVDVAGWGISPCVSKIDTLRGGGGRLASSGESFQVYTRFIRWNVSESTVN